MKSVETTVRLYRKPMREALAQRYALATPMQQLKVATEARHIAMEQTVDLIKTSSSLATYQALLQRFYGFYVPLETALRQLPWDQAGFDIEARLKSALLAADLQWLGLSAATLAAVPHCPTIPRLVDIPQALGYLYVSEGATLGGQVIIRQLQKRLPISRAGGGQFYNSYGAAVGPKWQQLSYFINSYITETRSSSVHGNQSSPEQRMIETAVLTFQSLQQWLLMDTRLATGQTLAAA